MKKTLFLIFTFFLLFSGCQQPKPKKGAIVDLHMIAGKSEKEVASYLGLPSECMPIKYGRECLYTKGDTAIVYIDKKADWITISDRKRIPFAVDTLKLLGLKQIKPNSVNQYHIRWRKIEGLVSVTNFVDYVYVKAITD